MRERQPKDTAQRHGCPTIAWPGKETVINYIIPKIHYNTLIIYNHGIMDTGLERQVIQLTLSAGQNFQMISHEKDGQGLAIFEVSAICFVRDMDGTDCYSSWM